jgi:hypothetical protein
VPYLPGTQNCAEKGPDVDGVKATNDADVGSDAKPLLRVDSPNFLRTKG